MIDNLNNLKNINDYYISFNVIKCDIPDKAKVDEIKTIIINQLKTSFIEKLTLFDRYFKHHSKQIKKLIESNE